MKPQTTIRIISLETHSEQTPTMKSHTWAAHVVESGTDYVIAFHGSFPSLRRRPCSQAEIRSIAREHAEDYARRYGIKRPVIRRLIVS